MICLLVIATNMLPLLLVLITLIHVPSVSAVTPLVVVKPQYITVNDTLYIEGGGQPANPTSAFYSLSLTTPWNDTAPPWTTLPSSSAPSTWLQSMAVTVDKTRLVIWNLESPTILSSFSVGGNTWSTSSLPAVNISNPFGQQALVDPTSTGATSPGAGVLYMPNGCTMPTTKVNAMCKLDLGSNTITAVAMPAQVSGNLGYYSFAYCASRNSMLLYGGYDGAGSPNLYEYVVGTNLWTLQIPLGTSPGDVNSHCMVQTSDNSMMILFGGMSSSSQMLSGLYLLHMNNFTWTQGADAGAANARAGHVCSTNGDSFIVWGGQQNSNNTKLMGPTPLIYNIPTNQWVHEFVVSVTPTSVTATATSTSNGTPAPGSSNDVASPPQGKSSNIGGAIGGAVGGAIVLAAVGFFFFRRHKKAPYNDGQGRFRKKGGFVGRGNENDRSNYDDNEYTGRDSVQLQESVAGRSNGEVSYSSSSSPIDPSSSSMAFVNKPLHSPASRIVSTTPSLSMLHRQDMLTTPSFFPPSTTDVFQTSGIQNATGFPPSEPSQYLNNHGGYEYSIPSPQTYPTVKANSSPPQYPLVGSVGYGTNDEGTRVDLRGPQQLGSRNEASFVDVLPYSYATTRRASHNPQSMAPTGFGGWDSGSSGSYYPPPPGQQQVLPEDQDLVQKKLRLIKAQHELDLERIRLEQESEVQLIKRQLQHGP
ncbi:hypothetical protein EMPS_07545 [Entomortierella parvispora]|uniref:Uncharacterized protein n=1 Tax=Entomortierella parvispora TaxID=205924 RepID=A0A9P3LYJ2_9FUNG|nr:hypothetical protein EMPS_07545 [Entomortierella parvispora]